ncbi:fumarylacetoacetate hydrolase family protein [Streptosporangium roseum]|uniref:fumarylacetoacetate hydrolase family protein n=1 Tax=Streptosporangium roseum TaxID=2001 RepID=UPI00332954E8
MRLTTFQTPQGATTYGAVTDRGLVDLGARLGTRYPDLKSLIGDDAMVLASEHLDKVDYAASDVTWLPVIPNPGKIICVGLNYEDHRAETGNSVSAQPAVFLRVPESQTGHDSPLLRPRESDTLDYEAEVAVVIGRPGRRIAPDAAWRHVAGLSCYNDGSVREFQRHTHQYTPGKNFPRTGAFGPWMVTMDEIPADSALTLSCRLNGKIMQHATTSEMIFSIPRIISYVSTFTTLAPGDVIATGTPGGVGARRSPQVFMRPGDTVEVEIDKIGVLRNTISDD